MPKAGNPLPSHDISPIFVAGNREAPINTSRFKIGKPESTWDIKPCLYFYHLLIKKAKPIALTKILQR